MKKLIAITSIVMATLVLFSMNSRGADPPHATAQGVKCNSCHSLHAAPGGALTKDADNANLCFSCHTAAGVASDKRLSVAMLANPGTSTGTSHRWDRSMSAGVAPLNLAVGNTANPYGLRTASELSSQALKDRLSFYNNVVTCSVCHNQHSQTMNPWDPNSSATVGEYGRHFMRLANEINQLCEDCHYYRTVGSGQTNVRTYDGKKKSHPIVKIFTSDQGETRDVSDVTQFNTSPLEPASAGWAKQTGARYHVNAGGDLNATNNVVVDSTKKIRCLSCHGMHYTDSNAATIDQP